MERSYNKVQKTTEEEIRFSLLYFNLQVKIKIISKLHGGGKRKKQIENFQEQRRIYIHLHFHHAIC